MNPELLQDSRSFAGRILLPGVPTGVQKASDRCICTAEASLPVAAHVQGGWVLSSRLGFGFVTAWEDAPSARHAVLSHLHCRRVGSKGSFCLYQLLNLTHFGRSWMKSTGRWLPLRDSLSGDKGVGWLILQIEFRPKGK